MPDADAATTSIFGDMEPSDKAPTAEMEMKAPELVVPDYDLQPQRASDGAEGEAGIYGEGEGEAGVRSRGLAQRVAGRLAAEHGIAKEAWGTLDGPVQRRLAVACFAVSVVALMIILTAAWPSDRPLAPDYGAPARSARATMSAVVASHVGSGAGCASQKSCAELRAQYHGGWPLHKIAVKNKPTSVFNAEILSRVCGESDNGLGPDVGWSNSCNMKRGKARPEWAKRDTGARPRSPLGTSITATAPSFGRQVLATVPQPHTGPTPQAEPAAARL